MASGVLNWLADSGKLNNNAAKFFFFGTTFITLTCIKTQDRWMRNVNFQWVTWSISHYVYYLSIYLSVHLLIILSIYLSIYYLFFLLFCKMPKQPIPREQPTAVPKCDSKIILGCCKSLQELSLVRQLSLATLTSVSWWTKLMNS